MRFKLALCLCLGMAATEVKLVACDCAAPPPVKKALEAATAVCLAEVVKVEVDGQSRTVTLKVERWWKGGEKQEITVSTSKSEASCGYGFEKAKKYLVYAHADKDKTLHVILCGRTRTAKEAEESGDFKELGEGKKPIAINLPGREWSTGLAAAVVAHALKDGTDPTKSNVGANMCLPFDETKPVKINQKKPVLLNGHTAHMYEAVFSADGNTLATTSADKTVRVWDVTTGNERAAIKLTAAAGVLLSADGRTIATIEQAGERRVRLWDAATGRQVGQPVAGIGAALSPDGQTLVLSDGWKAVLWDVAEARQRAVLTAEMAEGKSFTTWTFSPDGKSTATITADRTVLVWDAATGQKLSAIAGHTISWPISPRKARNETRWPQELTAQKLKDLAPANLRLAYSSDSRTLATARGGEIRLWDAPTARSVGTFPARTDDLAHFAFSVDGRTLIAASQRISQAGDGTGAEEVDVFKRKEFEVEVIIRRWDAKTGRAAPEVTAVSQKYGTGLWFAAFSRGLTRMAVPAGNSIQVSGDEP